MKKYFALLFICIVLFTGCNRNSASENENNGGFLAAPNPTFDTSVDVVEITEKMFVAQCNDVYLNPDDYEGKTISIEGMYDEYTDDTGVIQRAVIRNSPGCCQFDGVAGFQISCDDVPTCQQNDWICVEGIIKPFTDVDGYDNVIIENANITIKEERGAEYVIQ